VIKIPADATMHRASSSRWFDLAPVGMDSDRNCNGAWLASVKLRTAGQVICSLLLLTFPAKNLVMTIEPFTSSCISYSALLACAMQHFQASGDQFQGHSCNAVSRNKAAL
jgi:hypothetical protein